MEHKDVVSVRNLVVRKHLGLENMTQMSSDSGMDHLGPAHKNAHIGLPFLSKLSIFLK